MIRKHFEYYIDDYDKLSENTILYGKAIMIAVLPRSENKVPDSYKFSKAELRKINVETGKKFEWKGKPKTMTPLLKKRITLALTLMSGK